MAEFKALSLRECAMFDAAKYGANAMAELRKKWAARRYSRRPGKKTNVGDPMHNAKRR